ERRFLGCVRETPRDLARPNRAASAAYPSRGRRFAEQALTFRGFRDPPRWGQQPPRTARPARHRCSVRLPSYSRARIARHDEGRVPDQKEREEKAHQWIRLPSPHSPHAPREESPHRSPHAPREGPPHAECEGYFLACRDDLDRSCGLRKISVC